MAADAGLRQAVDAVSFWRAKVSRRFHKNGKKLATWNLWAAEDKAQHMAEAVNAGTVRDYDGPKVIDFELPFYRGSQENPEMEEE